MAAVFVVLRIRMVCKFEFCLTIAGPVMALEMKLKRISFGFCLCIPESTAKSFHNDHCEFQYSFSMSSQGIEPESPEWWTKTHATDCLNATRHLLKINGPVLSPYNCITPVNTELSNKYQLPSLGVEPRSSQCWGRLSGMCPSITRRPELTTALLTS